MYACTSTPRRRAYAPTSPSNMQCFFMMCKLCNDDSFLLCKELGCTCVRSTDGVLFMVIDLSCSAHIHAQKKARNALSHNALPCCCPHASCPHVIVPASQVRQPAPSQSASQQPLSGLCQPACSIFSAQRSRVFSSVQFSSVQCSSVQFSSVQLLGSRMLLSACHSIRTPCF